MKPTISIHSYHEFGDGYPFADYPGQVLDLASKAIEPLLQRLPGVRPSHMVIATTCPDSIAPSLGQEVTRRFGDTLGNCHVMDLVQGCAGGVTAMILGSQMARLNKSQVLVVSADAARKATSVNSENHKIFGNGAYAWMVDGTNGGPELLSTKSTQYPESAEVVRVRLGHDAGPFLKLGKELENDPRKYLGLNMDNMLAVKLLLHAKEFYDEFVLKAGCTPEAIILHQVNPRIIRHLKDTYRGVEMFELADIIGNCGAASVGIVLAHVHEKLAGKKVLLGSFGTGGVMTAGIWQF